MENKTINKTTPESEAKRIYSIFGDLSLLALNEIEEHNDRWDENKFWENTKLELKKLM